MADERPHADAERRTAPALRPLLGLAAGLLVIALYLGVRGGDAGDAPIQSFEVVAMGDGLRGGRAPGGPHRTEVVDGVAHLTWTATDSAVYTLVLLTPDYEELGRTGALEEPSARIDLASLPPGADEHAAVFWRILDDEGAAIGEGVGAIPLR